MAKAVFDELAKAEPKNGFTVGIDDDVSHTGLAYDPSFAIEPDETVRAVFYGLGSDGTVGANKNTVKIIAEDAGLQAQGYFVYDSHKSGAADGLASALRAAADPSSLSDRTRRISSAATSSTSSSGGTCCRSRRRARRSFSTAPTRRRRYGIACPGRCSVRSSARNCASSSSTLRERHGKSGSRGAPIRSCKPVSSRCRACCREPMRSGTSNSRSARPMPRRAMISSDAISRLSTVRSHACTKSRYRPRCRVAIERSPRVPGDAPEFVRAVTARMFEGRGDQIPVSLMPPRRHLPVGHGGVGETQHRRRCSGLGAGDLCAVRAMQLCLPAFRDPREIL